MEVYKKTLDDACIFELKGKFTFSDHQNFRKIINSISSKESKNIVLDLQKLEFVDSAALGMFLVAREQATKQAINLVIANLNGHPKKMFDISDFMPMFQIQS